MRWATWETDLFVVAAAGCGCHVFAAGVQAGGHTEKAARLVFHSAADTSPAANRE